MIPQNKVVLSWTARPQAENVIAYRIYETLPTGKTRFRAETPDLSVTLETTQGVHTYRVCAVSEAKGEGPLSAPLVVNVTPYAGAPGIPGNFSASVPFFP